MKKLTLQKIIVSLAFAVTGSLGVWFLWTPLPAAPQLAYTTLANETITANELRGQVVLVKFWATSCTTCVKQMPDTIAHYQTYRDRGFETIAVAMQYDPANYVINFAAQRQLPFKVVVDGNGEIARAFGDVRLTPTAFLIDRQGRIVKRYLGDYDKAEFVATLEKALAG